MGSDEAMIAFFDCLYSINLKGESSKGNVTSGAILGFLLELTAIGFSLFHQFYHKKVRRECSDNIVMTTIGNFLVCDKLGEGILEWYIVESV